MSIDDKRTMKQAWKCYVEYHDKSYQYELVKLCGRRTEASYLDFEREREAINPTTIIEYDGDGRIKHPIYRKSG